MHPRQVRLPLAAAPSSVRDARTVTRSVLSDWSVPPEVVDDALVVVSELVTNAVVHAQSPALELELADQSGRLRLALSDTSAAQPRQGTADASAESGRGISIVAALADRWGVAPVLPRGKQVWWEVDLRSRYGLTV